MLTIKNTTTYLDGSRSEFCREIKHYIARKIGNYTQLTIFNENSDCGFDIFSGFSSSDEMEKPVVSNIYVMNETGSTVANFRLFSDAAKVGGLEGAWE